MGDPPVGRGAPGEALALAPDCHDELLQADAVHALCQVTVPVIPHKTSPLLFAAVCCLFAACLLLFADVVCEQSYRIKSSITKQSSSQPHHKAGLIMSSSQSRALCRTQTFNHAAFHAADKLASSC